MEFRQVVKRCQQQTGKYHGDGDQNGATCLCVGQLAYGYRWSGKREGQKQRQSYRTLNRAETQQRYSEAQHLREQMSEAV